MSAPDDAPDDDADLRPHVCDRRPHVCAWDGCYRPREMPADRWCPVHQQLFAKGERPVTTAEADTHTALALYRAALMREKGIGRATFPDGMSLDLTAAPTSAPVPDARDTDRPGLDVVDEPEDGSVKVRPRMAGRIFAELPDLRAIAEGEA